MKQQNFSEEDIKKVAKGTGITLIGGSIGKGFLFLSQLLIARFLGVEAFGLYALGFASIKICELIAMLGLNTGSMRFVSIYKDNEPSKLKGILVSSIWICLISGAIIGFIFYLFSGEIAQSIFKKPEITKILHVFSISIPFVSGMTVVSSLLQGFHTTKYTTYTRNVIQPASNLILIGVFYWINLGLPGVIYAFILSNFIALLSGVVYLGKLFPALKNRGIKSVYEIKNLIVYSTPLLFVGFLNYFLSWTDTLMLGFLDSTKNVGIYRAASQVPFIMTFLLSATNSIYAPIAADLYAKNEMPRLSSIFKATTRWVSFSSIPIFVFLVFSAREIMMLFGKEYVETGHVVLVILSLGQLINCITGGVGFTLIMTGKQRMEFLNTLSMVIINVILNYVLIPSYGSIGAAIATSVSIAVINIIRFFEVNKLYNLNPFDKKFFKVIYPALISCLLFFVIKLTTNFNWYSNLLLNIIIITSMICLFLFVFNAEPEDEFILKKLKKRVVFGKK